MARRSPLDIFVCGSDEERSFQKRKVNPSDELLAGIYFTWCSRHKETRRSWSAL